MRRTQMGSARSLSAEMPEGNGTGFVWDDQVMHGKRPGRSLRSQHILARKCKVHRMVWLLRKLGDVRVQRRVCCAVQGNIVTNFHVLGSVLKGLGPRAMGRQQAPVKVATVTLLGAMCVDSRSPTRRRCIR